MPILAFLVSKDGKYLAVILALLAAIAWIYHRGETHVEAAEAKAVAAQVTHNAEVQGEIKAKVAAAVADYDALAPIPEPARVPVLVCHTDGGSLPQSTDAAAGGHGTGAGVSVGASSADAGSGAGFNPAPSVSATGTAADVEIAHLQKKIVLLQALIATYQSAGLVAK